MVRGAIFCLLFICLAAVQCQCQKKEAVQVTGKVRLVGSGTFSELVISGDGKQWYVASEEVQKLRDLQQRVVTIEGDESVKELTWASGSPAGKRWYLRNIRIINVE